MYIIQQAFPHHFLSRRLLLTLFWLMLAVCFFGCQTIKPSQDLQPEIPPWQEPTGNDEILPAPLYFVSTETDEKGETCSSPHIVRIERNGKTRTIITPCNLYGGINGFDVSPIDGSVVFIAQGGMWITNEKTEMPKLLISGLPNPEHTISHAFDIQNPVWSPDGTKIAYEDGGIHILDVTTGEILVVTEIACSETNYLLSYVFEDPCSRSFRYSKFQWSPDSKAILAVRFDEYRKIVVYTFDDNDEVTFSYESGYLPWANNGTALWEKDGNTFLIDQYDSETQEQEIDGKYALQRIGRDGSSSQLVWSHEQRRDFLFHSEISEKASADNLLETADGRILFSLGRNLVELTLDTEIVQTRTLTKIPEFNAWGWHWHYNGGHMAFRSDSGNLTQDETGKTSDKYSGKQFIGMLEIETGKIYLLAEEDVFSIPSFEELFEANHLVWGLP